MKKIAPRKEWSISMRINHWLMAISIFVLIPTGFYIADPFVLGIDRASAVIACQDAGHARDMAEHAFDAPEAAARKNCDFLARGFLGYPFCGWRLDRLFACMSGRLARGQRQPNRSGD